MQQVLSSGIEGMELGSGGARDYSGLVTVWPRLWLSPSELFNHCQNCKGWVVGQVPSALPSTPGRWPSLRCRLPFSESMRVLRSDFLYTVWVVHNSARGWLEFNTVEYFEMLKFVLSIFANGLTRLNLMASYFSRTHNKPLFLESSLLSWIHPLTVPKVIFLKSKAMLISFLKTLQTFLHRQEPRWFNPCQLLGFILHTSAAWNYFCFSQGTTLVFL